MNARRALLSVSDKTDIVDFATRLVEMGWRLLSTGGTAQLIEKAGLAVTEVARETGHPEMMDGRVKTLHPGIHGGILARRDVPADMAVLEAQGYEPIDLVVVNLYPFREAAAAPGATMEHAMDNLDVGGPAMLRAAAKNHRHVWIATDPSDYESLAVALADEAAGGRAESEPAAAGRNDASPAAAFRRRLAAKAFALSSAYDRAVADFLAGRPAPESARSAPPEADIADMPKAPSPLPLRYGENPGQTAAFLPAPGAQPSGLAALRQLQGKALSYNNYLDLDGALRALAPFAFCPSPAVVVVKHTSPCGLAVADTLSEAFARARRADPVSAFGSVMAANRPVDAATAAELATLFVECVAAPSFSAEALETLAPKKNLRLLAFPVAGGLAGRTPHPAEPARRSWWIQTGGEAQGTARFLARAAEHPGGEDRRSVYGGALVQSPPLAPFYEGADAETAAAGDDSSDWRVVTRRMPSEAEADDLAFAWAVVAGVKSNAIVLARDGATVGIGGGLASRVDAARLAVRKAQEAGLGDLLAGACLASDAFFPFRDAVDEAAEAGVRAVVQPGGSMRDQEVVDAADEHGMAMIFTGQRVFRH